MTLEELTKLFEGKATEVAVEFPDARGVPDDLDDLLLEIAKWVHIDEVGFARADVEHMLLECQVLYRTLGKVMNAFHEMLPTLRDDDD